MKKFSTTRPWDEAIIVATVDYFTQHPARAARLMSKWMDSPVGVLGDIDYANIMATAEIIDAINQDRLSLEKQKPT